MTPSGKRWNTESVGELDELLLKTINQLAADGWDLMEIRTVSRPTQAVQKVERDLVLFDPTRSVYTGTTSIQTSVDTRYLFRRALSR